MGALSDFLYYFRGISSGYPYSREAMICFIESIWNSLYREAKAGTLSAKEAKKYIEQIEAMLAEKTRQKIKGSDNEESTLLKAFKHFDSKALEYVNFKEFVRTLESFGVFGAREGAHDALRKMVPTAIPQRRAQKAVLSPVHSRAISNVLRLA